MTPNRWKSPVLACLACAFPLLGCASNLQTLSGAPVAPRSDPWARWAGYQHAINHQLLAQQFAQLDLDRQLPDLTLADPPRNPLDAVTQASAQANSGSSASGQEVFDQRILAEHNRERQVLGLVPLSWNPSLAASARRWADHLASSGRFEHAPENRIAPEGENLWAGSKGYFSPEAMVDAWIREKKYFRPGTFPDNSTTGRVQDVGHYTQVVWRATTQVGCAQARSQSEDILVCRYAEAGNYRGEVPF